MLVAEVVAGLTGKKLDFGSWEGNEHSQNWAKDVRSLIERRDIDVKLDFLQNDVAGSHSESISPQLESTKIPPEIEPTTNTKVTLQTGYDSDDSLTGYASPPGSRSPSPTPSALSEAEKDPTLNVGLKKVSRPVYLAQLGDLLRGSQIQSKADEPHEADKIEMALTVAEELIRKKRGYGTELGMFSC